MLTSIEARIFGFDFSDGQDPALTGDASYQPDTSWLCHQELDLSRKVHLA